MQHGDKAFFTLVATDGYTGHTGADFISTWMYRRAGRQAGRQAGVRRSCNNNLRALVLVLYPVGRLGSS